MSASIGRSGKAEAYNNRGATYANMGRYEEAKSDFDQAISLDPKLATAYYNRGRVLDNLSDTESADKDYKMAAQLGDKRGRQRLAATHKETPGPSIGASPPAIPAVREKKSRRYTSFGGGSGGEAESASLRLEGGSYSAGASFNFLLGLGLALTVGRDDTPDDLNEYPVPHSSYRVLGERNRGEEYGFYLKFGVEPIRDSGVFLFGLGGFSLAQEIVLAQSTVTGWYYEQSKKDKGYGLWGGGLGYYPPNARYNLSVSYDNRMGVIGMIGYSR